MHNQPQLLHTGNDVTFEELVEQIPEGRKLVAVLTGHLKGDISARLITDQAAFDLVASSAEGNLFRKIEWYDTANGPGDIFLDNA